MKLSKHHSESENVLSEQPTVPISGVARGGQGGLGPGRNLLEGGILLIKIKF